MCTGFRYVTACKIKCYDKIRPGHFVPLCQVSRPAVDATDYEIRFRPAGDATDSDIRSGRFVPLCQAFRPDVDATYNEIRSGHIVPIAKRFVQPLTPLIVRSGRDTL